MESIEGPVRSASSSVSTAPLNTSKQNADLLSKLFNGAQTVGCESNTESSPVTSSPSTDKTDNPDHPFDPFSLCMESADMRQEEERLKTFDKWPVQFLAPELLARNGFYYLGRGDEVRCAFCKVEIMRWIEGDDPAYDHQRWAPQCPFLRQRPSNASPEARLNGSDECGPRVPPAAPSTGAPAQLPRPAHPKYASVAMRLSTFADWPRSLRQKPEELADAGFFYTGQGDKTKCYYCDGGLKDWESDDDPWEQHARWFDRCAYLQLVKGREYVQRVVSEACAIPHELAERPATASRKDEAESSIEDSKVCRICYAEERNVCFVPCGHVVACAKCALSAPTCPMCRAPFSNAVRIYFS